MQILVNVFFFILFLAARNYDTIKLVLMYEYICRRFVYPAFSGLTKREWSENVTPNYRRSLK